VSSEQSKKLTTQKTQKQQLYTYCLYLFVTICNDGNGDHPAQTLFAHPSVEGNLRRTWIPDQVRNDNKGNDGNGNPSPGTSSRPLPQGAREMRRSLLTTHCSLLTAV